MLIGLQQLEEKGSHVLLWLKSTLSDHALAMVALATSSRLAWITLETSFQAQTRASRMQLKTQLQTLTKGSMSMIELEQEHLRLTLPQQSSTTALNVHRSNPRHQNPQASNSSNNYRNYNQKKSRPTCQLCSKLGHEAIDCWQRLKRRADGTIENIRRRLVAQGCSQEEGVDYFDTFSPAPRAWFNKLKTYLVSNGFKACQSDTSLFVHITPKVTIYVLVYVDDLIITGTDDKYLHKFIDSLKQDFSLKTFNMSLASPMSTPADPYSKLQKEGDPFSDPTLYRQPLQMKRSSRFWKMAAKHSKILDDLESRYTCLFEPMPSGADPAGGRTDRSYLTSLRVYGNLDDVDDEPLPTSKPSFF
ncbi:retrovirus-related pol polyprotein from transposon RE1 [Tanacetum coccineum]